MRKVFLIAIVPLTIFAAGCKVSSHGNCGCPNFGEHKVKQVNTDQVSIPSSKEAGLQ